MQRYLRRALPRAAPSRRGRRTSVRPGGGQAGDALRLRSRRGDRARGCRRGALSPRGRAARATARPGRGVHRDAREPVRPTARTRLDRSARAERRSAVAATLPLLRDEFRRAESLPGAPQGLVHGDLFIDNVLWIGDRVSSDPRLGDELHRAVRLRPRRRGERLVLHGSLSRHAPRRSWRATAGSAASSPRRWKRSTRGRATPRSASPPRASMRSTSPRWARPARVEGLAALRGQARSAAQMGERGFLALLGL